MHLNQSCRKFDEMSKSTKKKKKKDKKNHCLANWGRGLGWWRVSNCAHEPKLQEI